MLIQISIKHGVKIHKIEIDDEIGKIADVKENIYEQWGILVRNQTLILKGKTLQDKNSLKASGCTNGSKIMLIASGTAAPSAAFSTSKLVEKGSSEFLPEKKTISNWSERKNVWYKTGVISLRDEGLSLLPNDIFTFSTSEGSKEKNQITLLQSTTFVDFSNNCFLRTLPESFINLCALKTLKLDSNSFECRRVSENETSSEDNAQTSPTNKTEKHYDSVLQSQIHDLTIALSNMTQLTQLSLSRNKLSSLPINNFANFSRLEELQASHNSISKIPLSFDCLVSLRYLNLDFNNLDLLPNNFGLSLPYLEEFSAKNNRISFLPPTFGKDIIETDVSPSISSDISSSYLSSIAPTTCLCRLKKLDLASNRIAKLPTGFFIRLTALNTLMLHNNPIMMEEIREEAGFEAFDERRRRHVDKTIDGRVSILSDTIKMDQGADLTRNPRFK
mmetsp:Transcript_9224/g.17303  ORF Transcript_9224/g.17303 Transcript_9224/m.17303 type:complete len:446 (-) Transcript_9224:919-2256(-)